MAVIFLSAVLVLMGNIVTIVVKRLIKHKKMSKRSERLIRLLKYYIGDVFIEVEPINNLWKPRGNVIYIQSKSAIGFNEWLNKCNFIESVEDAGGNDVYKVKMKNGL